MSSIAVIDEIDMGGESAEICWMVLGLFFSISMSILVSRITSTPCRVEIFGQRHDSPTALQIQKSR